MRFAPFGSVAVLLTKKVNIIKIIKPGTIGDAADVVKQQRLPEEARMNVGLAPN
jgi:hypothetical protein